MICKAEVNAPAPSLATNHSTMPPGRIPSSGNEPCWMTGSTVGTSFWKENIPRCPRSFWTVSRISSREGFRCPDMGIS